MNSIFLMWICFFVMLISIAEVKTSGPEFNFPVIDIDIPESLVVGGSVTSLTAHDADGDRVDYFLVSMMPQRAHSDFNVAITGEITTKVALDFETVPKYTLVVRASSKDEIAEQTVYINVLNVNEAPVFENHLIGSMVPNWSTGGHVVTRLQATDPDLTTDIIFTITDGNTDGTFAIHQISGLVTVATGQKMNKTLTSAYLLTIEASDNGQPPKTSTCTLIIGVCNTGHDPKTTPLSLCFVFTFILLSRLYFL